MHARAAGRTARWTPRHVCSYESRAVHLHHLALGAQDVESLAEFYARAFELDERARHHHADGSLRSVWLDLGGAVLMIEAAEAEARPVTGVDPGWFLVAFAVPVSQRDAVEARLVALGGVVESRARFTSYARDPEGNRVAISHYPVPAHDA